MNFGQDLINAQVTILETNGNIISSKNFDSTNQAEFILKGASGIYFIQISSDNFPRATVRIIKE